MQGSFSLTWCATILCCAWLVWGFSVSIDNYYIYDLTVDIDLRQNKHRSAHPSSRQLSGENTMVPTAYRMLINFCQRPLQIWVSKTTSPKINPHYLKWGVRHLVITQGTFVFQKWDTFPICDYDYLLHWFPLTLPPHPNVRHIRQLAIHGFIIFIPFWNTQPQA